MEKDFKTSFEGDNYDCRYHYAGGGKHASKPHTHDFYEFFITINPDVLHFINGKVDVLPDATLVLIRPGDLHYFDYQGNSAPQHINLAFRCSVLDDLFDYLGEYGKDLRCQLIESPYPPTQVLTPKERQQIISELNQFNVIDPALHQNLRLTLRFFVAKLVFILAQSSYEVPDDTSPAWLQNLCKEMKEPENFAAGIERMVELSGKSREHLSRSMKKHKNCTITEFINDLRLEYAATMLVNSYVNITDICYDCGFSSLDYFGRLFRKRYAMSPTEFRTTKKT